MDFSVSLHTEAHKSDEFGINKIVIKLNLLEGVAAITAGDQEKSREVELAMNANKAITYSNKLCLHKVAMRVTSLSYEQFLCEALQVQKYFMSVKLFFGGVFQIFS